MQNFTNYKIIKPKLGNRAMLCDEDFIYLVPAAKIVSQRLVFKLLERLPVVVINEENGKISHMAVIFRRSDCTV